MRLLIALALLGTLTSAARLAADEPKRFAERTPLPRHPPAHTHERAGTGCGVASWAVPGVSPHSTGGIVGGGGLCRGAAPRPCDGTFGWDYTLFGRRPGRVFLGFLGDAPRQTAFAPKYKTDGPKVPDVVAAQPVRRDLREAKAEREGGHGGER